MADLQNLLNTIRLNASNEYQSRVPEATRTNITDVGNPIISYSACQNEFLNSLVERIALTIVRSKIAKNPLSVLKKGTIPLGKDIQEIITNLTKAETFNEEGTELLKRKKPDVKAIYHRMNRQDQYTVTITRQQLQTAFTSYANLNYLLTSIVNTLYSSDNYDEFILMKNLFASAITGNKIKTIRANMNKLVKCGNDVVTYNEDDNGGYYKIIPCANDGTKSKDGSLKGSYVIIDSRILQYLVNVYNSTAIKIYCTLKWLLYDKETEKEIERQLTIDFICKQIGLNEVSGKNRKMVSDVLNTFSKVGLINRKSFTYCNDKGDFITSYKYSINDYKTFKRIFSGK